MNNTTSFLPIELQNIIISYSRPVYPYIKALKEKEEEKQREIDIKIKVDRKRFFMNIKHYFNMYEGGISLNMFIRNYIYMSKVYSYRYELENDTMPFNWCYKIAHSGGSINYFKKVKREKRQKEIERKFKFMIDYWKKTEYPSDYEYNPYGDDEGNFINLGLKDGIYCSEYSDYIYKIKRELKRLKH